MGKTINANELFIKYPKLKFNGEGELHNVYGDLFLICQNGRIERVIAGDIFTCKKGNKIWFSFEITESSLVDKGIREDGK